MTFYESPQFQHYINSIPIKDTMINKPIYQPGYLRKVSYSYLHNNLNYLYM